MPRARLDRGRTWTAPVELLAAPLGGFFDPETGGVTAVTVIEAGPCPVTHVRDESADGYAAVQLAYEPVADRKITKGEIGHLKKSGASAHRHLVEFRGESELAVGDTVTVEAFQPGDPIKVAGTSIGKGFQGTIKRHNFRRGPVSHGSHNVRAPGSIGASATPSRESIASRSTSCSRRRS